MKSKAVAAILVAVVALIVMHYLVSFQTVGGHQVGVKETWSGGVDPSPLPPRTYMFLPGFTTQVYLYDTSSQVFVMNNTSSRVDRVGVGRESDAYKVQSEEGQDMTISLSVRWRIDPAQVVQIHKTVRRDIEEKIIRPSVMRVVKDAATARKAIEAYSGPGLVALQKEIEDNLAGPKSDLRARGIIVENFVIEGIVLDPEYIGEIKARQVASQKKLRAEEEEKAALAVAEKAKAEAQADFNKQLVEAERDKEMGVLGAEKLAKQQTLAAEAQKQTAILSATGEQQASELKAQAIAALGKAEAEATRLRMSAYSAPGAELYVKMEVSRNIGMAFSNIRGFLPSDMKFNVLTDSVQKSVNLLLNADGATVAPRPPVPAPPATTAPAPDNRPAGGAAAGQR